MPRPVLVLGATGGLGGAIAAGLARDGHTLILHGRRRDRLEAAFHDVGTGQVAGTEICDMTSEAEVEQLCARIAAAHGGLGGLVFSIAEPFANRLTYRIPWTVFERQMATQLKALHLICSKAYPLLKTGETTRRVVVVGTEFVEGVPPVKTAPYVAAKAAITAYAQVIAQEWLADGIRVHIVAPGLVRTDLVTGQMPDAYLESLAERMPEKRLTEACDVARLVAFLFTDGGDPMYGMPLRVSRGERR